MECLVFPLITFNGPWFSSGTPGTLASSTIKTGHHDIAESGVIQKKKKKKKIHSIICPFSQTLLYFTITAFNEYDMYECEKRDKIINICHLWQKKKKETNNTDIFHNM